MNIIPKYKVDYQYILNKNRGKRTRMEEKLENLSSLSTWFDNA